MKRLFRDPDWRKLGVLALFVLLIGVVGWQVQMDRINTKGIINIPPSPIFTDTQMNLYMQSLLNGINPATEFQATQGIHSDTEAGTFGIAVPNSATVLQASAVAGYVSNNSPLTNAVAGYFNSQCLSANTACWAINPILQDSANTGIKLLNEFDYNVKNANTQVSGLATGVFTAQPAAATAWEVGKPAGGGLWVQGFLCDTGATLPANGYSCIKISPIGNGVNQQSQEVTFVSNDPVSGTHIYALFEDASGNLIFNGTSAQSKLTVNGDYIPARSFTSPTANPAQSGQIRLASIDAIGFRNNANSSDILIGKNTSDQFTFGGALASPALIAPTIGASGSTINSDFKGSGTLTYTAIAANACQEQPLTITGAVSGDVCYASPAADIGANFQYGGCRVSGANTAQVRACSGAGGTPSAQTWTGWARH